jgi:predicted metal-dependent HD superfamily phosphohydrolase
VLERFVDALGPGVDPEMAVSIGRDLLSRWDEPHRRYHTRAHLVALLSIVDEQAGSADVRLAAWYHDAVYDPTRPDNEERSADLARDQLTRLGVDSTEVVRLVLLTRTHDPDGDDTNGKLLCDADLAILASTVDSYRSYAVAIRDEYAHVPDDAFALGRAGVLEQLLALPVLFHTPGLRDRWEATARANVEAELRSLREVPGPAQS